MHSVDKLQLCNFTYTDGVGPWHRTISGFSGGAVITAAATHWGNEAAPWIALGAGVLLLATLGHGWAWPRLRQRRAGRHEEGYRKIVGGYRSVNRLWIRYADGTQDNTAYPGTGEVAVEAYDLAGRVSQPSWWQQYKRWWKQRPRRT